jgi:lipopolysaccharide export system protein LptA
MAYRPIDAHDLSTSPRLGLTWFAFLLATLMIVSRGISAEAQAAVTQPRVSRESGDPLLGSLSFTSSDEPVEVTARSLEFDYRTRVLVYRGDVVAKQGDVQLKADTLTLDLRRDEKSGEKSELRSVVAEGNVHFSKGDRRATAGRAVYNQAKRLIVLSDDAVLEDSRGNVSGDTVHVYLDEERTLIEGGSGRVRAVLRPKDKSPGETAKEETANGGGTP